MAITRQFVVGLLFNEDADAVVLVVKARPKWQCGLLNGPGGALRDGEPPEVAIEREYREETGIAHQNWQGVLKMSLTTPEGDTEEVFFFTGRTADPHLAEMDQVQSDEPPSWYALKLLPQLKVIPDLSWIIPLALHQPRADMRLELFR